MDLTKQRLLFVPDKSTRFYVYGCGSIGSHVIISLAKTGFDNITVYDFDTVEESNLPAQFFDVNSLNKSKAEQIARLAESMTGTNITYHDGMITKDNLELSNLQPGSFHIVCLDNIKYRYELFNTMKGFPVIFIDLRIGKFNYQKYVLKMNDEMHCKQYSKTLEGSFSELMCGEKCLWVVNSYLASLAVTDIIKLKQKTDIDNIEIGDVRYKNKVIGKWKKNENL